MSFLAGRYGIRFHADHCFRVKYQSVFMKNCCTETVMLRVWSELVEANERKLLSWNCSISRSLLIASTKRPCCSPHPATFGQTRPHSAAFGRRFNWFGRQLNQSFLTDWTQRVAFFGQLSRIRSLIFCVALCRVQCDRHCCQPPARCMPLTPPQRVCWWCIVAVGQLAACSKR